MMMEKPTPFRIDVPQAKLDRILGQVRFYEWFLVLRRFGRLIRQAG